MSGVKVGVAYIPVSADMAPFEREITALPSSRIGKSMEKVGKSLTRNLTLPLVGIGGVAAKLSLDFSRSMELVATQAGGTQKEVKKLSDTILKLSENGRFAQGPNELAEALFHIESVGYRGAKAMKTLKAASDLATVGHANLDATTNALVGAMKTGVKGAGSLRQSIGTLNATIGAGNLRMEDLNAALGTGFLATAKQVGLSLRDAGAAVAELTSQGIPASAAATRLRMTFSLMAAPTEKAQNALEGIGLNSESLAKKMRQPNGLVGAVSLLKEHLDGLSKVKQTDILNEAFGGSRSGGTITALVNGVGDLSKKYEEIGKNAGKFGQAVKSTNEESSVELEKSLHRIEAVLIRLGESLLPIVVSAFAKIADLAGKIGDLFAGLSTSGKKLFVDAGLFLAAAGPGLTIVGKLVQSYGAFAYTLRKTAEAYGLLATAQSASGASGVAGAASRLKLPFTSKVGAGTGFVSSTLGVEGGAVAPLAIGAPEVVAALAGIAAIGAGLYVLYQHSKTFRAEVGQLSRAVASAFNGIKKQIEPLVHSFSELGNAWSHASIGKEIDSLKGPIGTVAKLFKGTFVNAIKGAFAQTAQVINGIGQAFAGMVEMFRGVIQTISAILTGKWGKAWAGVETIFHGGISVILGSLKALTSPFKAAAVLAGGQLSDVFGGTWKTIKGIFKSGVNDVIGFLNTLIGAVEEIPGVPSIGTIAEIGSNSGTSPNVPSRHALHHGKVHKQRGGPINMGAPTGDTVPAMLERGEYVLNRRAVEHIGAPTLDQLNFQAAPRFALGGIANAVGSAASSIGNTAEGIFGTAAGAIGSLPTPHLPKWLAGLGSYILSQVGSYIKSGFQSRKLGHLVGPKGGGASMGPQGIGSYMGIPMADWVIQSLQFAAGKGVAPHPTSGYRPPGQVISGPVVAPQGYSEHQGTQYPHGAVDFGGPIDPAAKIAKMAVVHATGGFKYPLLAPIGFRDDGHASGTGHAKGGHIGFKHGAPILSAGGEKVRELMQRVWPFAAPFYGRSPGSSPPPANFDTNAWGGLFVGDTKVYGRKGNLKKNFLVYPKWFESWIGKKPNVVKENLLHEWAHYFQKPGIGLHAPNWVREGGAEAFGLWAGPKVYGAAGIPYQNPPLPKNALYYPYVQNVLKNKGMDWVEKGQFGKQRGGLIGRLMRRFSTGGPVPPKGGELVGASYYGGPTDHVSGTVGAAGVSLPGTSSFAELAMGHALGDLPFHTKLKISHAGKSVIAEKLDIGLGGGSVGGKNRAIDLWYETAAKLGINGLGVVKVEPAEGAAIGSSSGSTAKPKLPANIAAHIVGGSTSAGGTNAPGNVQVNTAKLPSFGSLPTTIPTCQKELAQRRTELAQYKIAIRKVKDTETRSALTANINLLKARIKALIKQKARLAAKALREKTVKKIEARGTFPMIEKLISAKEHAYNRANEYAEQIAALEPEDSGAAATYVKGSEKPAWLEVLSAEAGWRNAILGGEEVAGGRLRSLEGQVESINALKKTAPALYKKQKFRLPGLTAAINAVKAIYSPASASSLKALAAGNYAPATGELPQALEGLQGIGDFPGGNMQMPTLPSTPVAGMFGNGLIWSTQLALRALGISGKGNAEVNTGRTELLEELLRQANRRTLASEAGYSVLSGFPPYAGKAHTGAVVPGPPTQERTMVLQGGEGIFTSEQMAAMGGSPAASDVEVHIHGDVVSKRRDPVEVVINDRRFAPAVQRHAKAARGVGIATPGGARR